MVMTGDRDENRLLFGIFGRCLGDEPTRFSPQTLLPVRLSFKTSSPTVGEAEPANATWLRILLLRGDAWPSHQ